MMTKAKRMPDDGLEQRDRSSFDRREWSELRYAHETLGHDLDLLKALIDDAVACLTASFADISEAGRSLVLSKGSACDSCACHELGIVIGRGADEVATRLQFHDMATQLLRNLRERVRMLESVGVHGSVPVGEVFAQIRALEQRKPSELQVEVGGGMELF